MGLINTLGVQPNDEDLETYCVWSNQWSFRNSVWALISSTIPKISKVESSWCQVNLNQLELIEQFQILLIKKLKEEFKSFNDIGITNSSKEHRDNIKHQKNNLKQIKKLKKIKQTNPEIVIYFTESDEE